MAGTYKAFIQSEKCLLHTQFASAEKVYYIEETEIKKVSFLNEKEQNTVIQAQKEKNLKDMYDRIKSMGIRVITCFMDTYPQKLKRNHRFSICTVCKRKSAG